MSDHLKIDRLRNAALRYGWVRSVDRPGMKYLASALNAGRYVRTWADACSASYLTPDRIARELNKRGEGVAP